MKLSLQNVRSLIQVDDITIKPLTFLVGENSSGKTTFLAALSAIGRGELFQYRPQFNHPPYDLGSFDTIATYKGGRYGRASDFSVGYKSDSTKRYQQVFARYIEDRGQPILSHFILETDELRFEFRNDENDPKVLFTQIRNGSKENQYEFSIGSENLDLFRKGLGGIRGDLPLYLMIFFEQLAAEKRSNEVTRELRDLRNLMDFRFLVPTVRDTSIAPIRTKPKRTYDEIEDAFKPEGGHIPIRISRILAQESSEEKRTLVELLEDYGNRSGLFKEVKAKRLGVRPSDPFQLRVTVAGREANIVDVGYGISQVLPILVESILAKRGSRITMQQPEVHLHPRAQAALGSFLVKLTEKYKKMFVIETHSDFIIDRVRQEVADGSISPEKVAILFFEKPKMQTTIHQLSLDRQGNILNAPPAYRQFFLDEQVKMLTGTLR